MAGNARMLPSVLLGAGAAMLTVGALPAAALLTFPEAEGFLGLPGHRALRIASHTAGAWMVSADFRAVGSNDLRGNPR